jgi:spermidine synthase
MTYFVHGTTIHGAQYTSAAKRKLPTFYFNKRSGVGVLLQKMSQKREQTGKHLRVCVLGLGVGTLATYGKQGDMFHFYEIDPDVAMIAKKYFSYLSDSPATIDVRIADGRLGLEQELMQQEKDRYDVIVMDAFSDDTIPVHLLTKEAIAIYEQRLAPDGALAVNIANNYLDLSPLMRTISSSAEMSVVFAQATIDDYPTEAINWALFSKNKQFLQSLPIKKAKLPTSAYRHVPMWTDQYSNILSLLR